ncbi:hypothetical protein J2850_002203 [Azospirillum picis]|uniref:Uncharacterized protein n=1 Tax=Azospirillum picis TaxID=488438 RepID=A0ABU0MIT3_9PROT|nr:hypothetical protein [Azospirillum picis]MDQ0533360.1 hypothetical protein [Azospirillum picis]
MRRPPEVAKAPNPSVRGRRSERDPDVGYATAGHCRIGARLSAELP